MTIMSTKTAFVEIEGADSDEESIKSEKESDVESSIESENEDEEENSDNENTNLGWVDSISKILKTNKPKGKKSIVLSKAKKLTDVKEKPKPAGYELQTETGEVKEEKIDPLESLVKKLEEEPTRKRKRELPDFRVKPNILEKDRERTLSKIATKGVVQLFNAVRTQQKDIDNKLKEAGPLEVKRDKVLKNVDKRAFLDGLMGEKSLNLDEVAKKPKTEKNVNKESNSTWNVLRDDFMLGAKMKDWDKELEEEEEIENVELE